MNENPAMTLTASDEAKLAQLDSRLADIIRVVARRCPFAFAVTQTARTIEQQQQYFDEGKSRIDPKKYPKVEDLYVVAKHITGPGMPMSRAVDLNIVGKDPYNVPTLTFLAGMIRSAAIERGVRVRWGGDFDQDGLLLEPGTFQDLPHHELITT